MSESIKWIKITTDIFDDEKILLIESMPEHDSIIVIWFKLLALAGKSNNNGVFMLSDKLPYTDEMLASIFRRPLATVRLALEVFERFGMIVTLQNVITIPNWEKHQNIDGLDRIRQRNRERVARCREKQKKLAEIAYIEETSEKNDDVTLQGITSNDDVIECNALEEDKDKEEDKDNNIVSPPGGHVPKTIEPKAKELAELMYSLHKQVDQKAKKPNIDSWAMDIEKINRLDGRSYDEIEKVIRWVKIPGNFWFANIMSGKKLRMQFSRLFIEANKPQRNGGRLPMQNDVYTGDGNDW